MRRQLADMARSYDLRSHGCIIQSPFEADSALGGLPGIDPRADMYGVASTGATRKPRAFKDYEPLNGYVCPPRRPPYS